MHRPPQSNFKLSARGRNARTLPGGCTPVMQAMPQHYMTGIMEGGTFNRMNPRHLLVNVWEAAWESLQGGRRFTGNLSPKIISFFYNYHLHFRLKMSQQQTHTLNRRELQTVGSVAYSGPNPLGRKIRIPQQKEGPHYTEESLLNKHSISITFSVNLTSA